MGSAPRWTYRPFFGTRERVIDDVVELYVIWRERAAAVWVAYDAWAHAGTHIERAAAGAAFREALDEEQFAADEYADFVAYAARVL
jgi:hypothetical protein